MNTLDLALQPDFSEVESGILYLSIEIKIDGLDPLASSGGEDFDIYELFMTWSAKNKEPRFVFTCSCGVPGCAGFFKGIDIRHETTAIEWNDQDQNIKYEFPLSEYKKKLDQLSSEVIKWYKYTNDLKLELKVHPEWEDASKIVELAKMIKSEYIDLN